MYYSWRFAAMDTELLKGTLSLLILSLLSRRPMYGYEIAATVHSATLPAPLLGARDRFIRVCTSCRPTG